MKRTILIILALVACDAQPAEPAERAGKLATVDVCAQADEFGAACAPTLACEMQSTIAAAEAVESVAICKAGCARAWEVCLYDETPGSGECQQCEFTAAACTGLCE